MNRKMREKLQRQQKQRSKWPRLGALMRIDGVVHECVATPGAFGGGVWAPYARSLIAGSPECLRHSRQL